jgi:predicted ATPase
VRAELPTGRVTLLFTDIEGSTKLIHELGPDGYASALEEHRRTVRDAFRPRGGVEVDTQGDAFFYAFPEATGAVDAAAAAQEALCSGPIRVRMGIHTGAPHVAAEGYVGEDVHKAARIAAAGHGGQVLLSKQTRELTSVQTRDLGEHRLKDFAEPVWIFQLGRERFAPLRTISNTNLPRPASSFVGRERELRDVLSRIRDGARLVTLTGPGGSGKTRLAIEAASELVPDHRNGVFWVGLSTLTEPALVMETIAQTLGIKGDPAEHIAGRDMLLLLDNFEQVVDAAPAVSSLLAACPDLRLIVTSRELLRIKGEVNYPVLPLADPEAVTLFCARSQLQPDDTIAALCRALENLPLAVELAAARTSVLSPAHILERIGQRLDILKGGRDAEERQRTLRATIEWSHDLLTAAERTLFAHLGVFRGGTTLEAAEAIADADIDTLQSLVDKSLVRHTGGRFWMLETIREFALERLADSSESGELAHKHAHHFLALAEEAEPAIFGMEPQSWLDRLEAEHDNLRAALDYFEASRQIQLVYRLAGSLSEFWGIRGHLVEGRRRLERVLPANLERTPARARALDGAAGLAGRSGDTEASRSWAAEALELHRTLEEPWRTAWSLAQLGFVALEDGDLDTGLRLGTEAVRMFRELGDEHNALSASRVMAAAYDDLGHSDKAREVRQDMLRRARALGDRFIEAKALAGTAMLTEVLQGQSANAVAHLAEAYRIHRDVGDRHEITIVLCEFASVLATFGRFDAAARILACAEALREEISAREHWVARLNAETADVIRQQLDESVFDTASEEGRRLTPDEAVDLALQALDSPE